MVSPLSEPARSAGKALAGWPLGPFVLLVLFLALAKEARELGGERVARREVVRSLEHVDAPLELLDVLRRLGVGGNRFAHLLAVLLGRLLELGEIDVGLNQLAE